MRCNPRKQKPPPRGNGPCAGSLRREPGSPSKKGEPTATLTLLDVRSSNSVRACPHVAQGSLTGGLSLLFQPLGLERHSRGFKNVEVFRHLQPAVRFPSNPSPELPPEGCGTLIGASEVPPSASPASLLPVPSTLRNQALLPLFADTPPAKRSFQKGCPPL